MQPTLRTVTFRKPPWRCAVQSLQTDDATVTGIPTDRPEGALLTMVTLPTIGVVLVLVGLALFLVDLKVTNHGLPIVGAILALLVGGFALLGAGVPYSEVLIGAVVVVAMLMGACSSGFWVPCTPSEVGRPSPARRE